MEVYMISYVDGESKFNFRVSGIIIDEKNEKFLTNTAKGIDFYVLPGGRVEIQEDTENALKREIKEELGEEINAVCLKAIIENFFEFDSKKYHELQFFYVAKLNNKELEKNQKQFLGVENKDIYEWQNIKNIGELNYKPSIMKVVIKEVFSGDYTFRHIIHKGNG